LLAEHAVLIVQEVDDLELAGVDPARHPQDQEPRSLATHRGDMVARLVIHLDVQRTMTSYGDALRFPLGRLSARDAIVKRTLLVLSARHRLT
jgi:hypothetical protein